MEIVDFESDITRRIEVESQALAEQALFDVQSLGDRSRKELNLVHPSFEKPTGHENLHIVEQITDTAIYKLGRALNEGEKPRTYISTKEDTINDLHVVTAYSLMQKGGCIAYRKVYRAEGLVLNAPPHADYLTSVPHHIEEQIERERKQLSFNQRSTRATSLLGRVRKLITGEN